jgi:hypothetical protein
MEGVVTTDRYGLDGNLPSPHVRVDRESRRTGLNGLHMQRLQGVRGGGERGTV